MTPPTVGVYYLRTRNPDDADRAEPLADRIATIVQQQVNLRGADKPFHFRALGYAWQYQPTNQPLPIAPEVEAKRAELLQIAEAWKR